MVLFEKQSENPLIQVVEVWITDDSLSENDVDRALDLQEGGRVYTGLRQVISGQIDFEDIIGRPPQREGVPIDFDYTVER